MERGLIRNGGGMATLRKSMERAYVFLLAATAAAATYQHMVCTTYNGKVSNVPFEKHKKKQSSKAGVQSELKANVGQHPDINLSIPNGESNT